jgi:Caenorhabditis protein of unknown function, DUF268
MPDSSSSGIARRLFRALMRPLDGRVADVNRRIEGTTSTIADVRADMETLTHEVSVHAATATESNAYVGVEMRNVQDSLEALQERIGALTDRDYAERMQRVVELPLDELDGTVANLLNQAGGHRGFAAQAGLWFNPPVTVEFHEGAVRIGDVNERIVEVPWAFSALARLDGGARILEIGSAESTFALSVASLGHRVTALDLHPLPYSHPNLESIVARFEDWEAPSEPFDAVFLISTIEHFGLGAYGEHAAGNDADRKTIERVGTLLGAEGFLVLTTPYGSPQLNDLERVYDEAGLSALLDGWMVLERSIVAQVDSDRWVPLDDGEVVPGEGRAVAMVVAVPPRLA